MIILPSLTKPSLIGLSGPVAESSLDLGKGLHVFNLKIVCLDPCEELVWKPEATTEVVGFCNRLNKNLLTLKGTL